MKFTYITSEIRDALDAAHQYEAAGKYHAARAQYAKAAELLGDDPLGNDCRHMVEICDDLIAKA